MTCIEEKLMKLQKFVNSAIMYPKNSLLLSPARVAERDESRKDALLDRMVESSKPPRDCLDDEC